LAAREGTTGGRRLSPPPLRVTATAARAGDGGEVVTLHRTRVLDIGLRGLRVPGQWAPLDAAERTSVLGAIERYEDAQRRRPRPDAPPPPPPSARRRPHSASSASSAPPPAPDDGTAEEGEGAFAWPDDDEDFAL
jgi:hypothetical protein